MGSGPGTASRSRGGGAGGLAVGRDLEQEMTLAAREETPPEEAPPEEPAQQQAADPAGLVANANIRNPEPEEVNDLSQRMFGRELSNEEWASLAGAVDGTNVRIYTGDYEFGEEGIDIEWKDPVTGAEGFRSIADGVIYNNSFKIPESAQGGGTAVRSLARQVNIARRLGIKSLNIEAAGNAADSTYVGYKVWPKFGYDAIIPSYIQHNLPREFRSAKRVSDLYKTAEGRAAWATHGDWTTMSLDLTPGSAGLRRFLAYAKSKGIQM